MLLVNHLLTNMDSWVAAIHGLKIVGIIEFKVSQKVYCAP